VLVSCCAIGLALSFYWRGGIDLFLGVHTSNLVTGIFYNIVTLYAIFILMASLNKANITNSMEQNNFCKANSFSASQEISCILWNPKFRKGIHKNPTVPQKIYFVYYWVDVRDVKGTPPEYKPQEKPLESNSSIPLDVISAGDEVMLYLTIK
jgi:hypothetical protein